MAPGFGGIGEFHEGALVRACRLVAGLQTTAQPRVPGVEARVLRQAHAVPVASIERFLVAKTKSPDGHKYLILTNSRFTKIKVSDNFTLQEGRKFFLVRNKLI